jgi:hypothetical protein
MQAKINYVTLLILIILGVAVGNLASSFIAAKYFNDYEQRSDLAEESKTVNNTVKHEERIKPSNTPKDIQETVKLSPEESPKSLFEPKAPKDPAEQKLQIEERKLDENGLRLAKTCNEWTIVHKDMQTQTSERGMNKHCAEYYDYLSFGNLPESN